jgi:hypothetical protein
MCGSAGCAGSLRGGRSEGILRSEVSDVFSGLCCLQCTVAFWYGTNSSSLAYRYRGRYPVLSEIVGCKFLRRRSLFYCDYIKHFYVASTGCTNQFLSYWSSTTLCPPTVRACIVP